jgi:hypothetical protein
MHPVRQFPMLRTLALTVLLAASVAAQNSIPRAVEDDGWRPHTFFGGDVYLTFGSWNSVGASPMIGYTPVRNLYGGVGLTYIHSWGNGLTYYVKGVKYTGDLSSNTFGGRVFLQYYLIPQLFAKTEFQYYTVTESGDNGYSNNYSVPYLLVGGGYRQPVSRNTYLEISVMFDVLNDPNSWYGSGQPIWGVGIVVGI